jgi:hypothetical protein
MKRPKNAYDHINSFNDLKNEQFRLLYETRLARRKLEMSVLELQSTLSPIRLLGTLFSEWAKPVKANIKQWLVDFIQGRSKKNREEVK